MSLTAAAADDDEAKDQKEGHYGGNGVDVINDDWLLPVQCREIAVVVAE